MSDRSKFLVGCGAGIFATLLGTSLFSTTRGRSPRSQAERPSLPGHPPVETDRQRATNGPGKAGVGRNSRADLGSPVPAVEHAAQGHVESESSGIPLAHANTKRAWYRRFKAMHWIIAVGAMIVAVAVVCFGVDFREQMKKMNAQLTRSETTMLALQDGVRIDQRAWVGLMEATPQPLNGTGGGFTIKLQNTGKTPALDLHISDVITVEDIDQAGEPKEPDTPARNSAGTLMPGGVYTTDVWFQTSPDAVSSLAHNQMRAVNFVRVTYKDVYQVPHATKVCFYWHSSLPRVKPCDGYNEMN